MHLSVDHCMLDGTLDTQVSIAIPVGVEGSRVRVVEAREDFGIFGS